MAAKSIPQAREPKLAQRFTRALLAWFERTGRDLPWRRTRDPYRIVVSEFMLQQTQVRRVLEYYPRFLKRFPTVYKLAAAKPKAVREEWEGLGYYARATNLHALAKKVSGAGGQVPDTPEELIKLPGVGRYTAGAVASFAYEKPVAAVDTNVARVIRRAFMKESGGFKKESGGFKKESGGFKKESGVGSGSSQANGGSARVKRKRASKSWTGITPHSLLLDTWAIATALVPKNGRRAWRFNQAIMELGAIVCTARKPKCPECPVRKHCRTGRRGIS